MLALPVQDMTGTVASVIVFAVAAWAELGDMSAFPPAFATVAAIQPLGRHLGLSRARPLKFVGTIFDGERTFLASGGADGHPDVELIVGAVHRLNLRY